MKLLFLFLPIITVLLILSCSSSDQTRKPVDTEVSNPDDTIDGDERPDLDNPNQPATISESYISVAQPNPPKKPEPVNMESCPEGWEKKEIVNEGNLLARYCEPAATEQSCPEGEMPLLGKGCSPVGNPCPEGDFHDVQKDGVIRVSAGESLEDAIGKAPTGSTILLGKGIFEGGFFLENMELTIIGACAEKTIITESSSDDSIIKLGKKAKLNLGNLTIKDLSVDMHGDSVLHIDSSIIKNSSKPSVLIDAESTLTAERVFIDGSETDCIDAIYGGNIRLKEVTLKNCGTNGIALCDGSENCFSDLKAENLLISQCGERGIALRDGSTLELTGAVIEKAVRGGILLSGPADVVGVAQFTLKDVVVREIGTTEKNQKMGYGIAVVDAAFGSFENLVISDVRMFGLSVLGDSLFRGFPYATLKNGVITNVKAQKSDGILGRGFSVEYSGYVEAEKLLIHNVKTVGLLIIGREDAGPPATLKGKDIIVEKVDFQDSDQSDGEGIVLFENATAELQRVSVRDARTFGILVSVEEPPISEGYRTLFKAEDLEVSSTKPDKNGIKGVGVGIFRNSEVDIKRALVKDNCHVGFFVSSTEERSDVSVEDLLVTGTKATLETKSNGLGAAFQLNTKIHTRRMAAVDNRSLGIFITGSSEVEGSDISVSKNKIRECYESGCPELADLPMGYGIGIYDGATVKLADTEFIGNNTGIDLSGATLLAGEECSETGKGKKPSCLRFIENNVGLNAWNLPEGYDLDSELKKAVFYENGTNVTKEEQEPPAPIELGSFENDPTDPFF